MPSDLVDRLRGVKSSQAIKVPCRVATTANITLSGEQTIDGVAVVDGDRVLVKDQSTGSENGIYECDTGAWSRTPDWDGVGDVVKGTQVRVTDGSTQDGVWTVSTANPITIGTTSITLVRGDLFDKASDTSDEIIEGSTKLLMTVTERLSIATITTYGGVAAMAAALGYVTFPPGNTPIASDTTIDVPVKFMRGAYVTVASGQTLTISSRIESERQHIFRGDGSVSLFGDGDSGEDSKEVHISWFGGFPTHNDEVDASPAIVAANAALGNLREGVIEFDSGSYWILSESPILINRGVCLQGAGTRRTVFRITTDDVEIFTTNGVACKFQDIQFELQGHTSRTAAYIGADHEDAEVYRVLGQHSLLVDLRSDRGRVENVSGVFGANLAAGSALVRLASGVGHRVRGVQALTSAFGPEALVRIGGSGAVGDFLVADVQSILPACIPVVVDGSAGNVVRGEISGVRYTGSSGTSPDAVVDFINSSTFIMSDITLAHIQGTANAANGIRLRQTGSGTLEDIQIALTSISGSTGTGIVLLQSSGTMRDIFIADTVNVAERTTPISYSGSMSNVRVSPQVTPNGNSAYCYQFSITDDSVATLNLRRSVFTGRVELTAGSTHYGDFVIRAASSPAVTNKAVSANVESSAAALAGTTGNDGKLTLGVQEGVLYVENRLGSTQTVMLAVMAGA